MHPELILRAISGITSPHTNVDEFMVNSRILSKSVAKHVLRYLNLKGIRFVSGGMMTFSRYDRLKTAIMALQIGCDIERVKPINLERFRSIDFGDPKFIWIYNRDQCTLRETAL